MFEHYKPSQELKRAYDIFVYFYRQNFIDLKAVFFFGVLVGILSLTVPIGVQALVNSVAFTSLLQPVIFLVMAVLLGLVIAGFFKSLQLYIVEILQRRMFAGIALEVSNKIPKLDTSNVDKRKAGEMVNRFFDVVTVQKTASSLLTEGLALVLQTGIGLFVLAFYHPFLLVFDIILVIGLLFVFRGLGSGAIKTSILESKEKHKFVGWLEEMVLNLELLKQEKADKWVKEKTKDELKLYLNARSKHFSILFRQIIGALLLQAGASALLLGLGGYLVLNNQLSLGQLVAAELIVSNLVNSLTKFHKHWENYYDMVAAFDKLGELMALPTEPIDPVNTKERFLPFRPKINVNDCHFNLGPHASTVLRVDKISIKGGESLGVLGEYGSGKTIFLNSILGIRTPEAGSIEIDDIDLRQMPKITIRNNSLLLRGIDVVHGSIADNLSFASPDVDTQLIYEALDKVRLKDKIQSFKDGLQTMIWPGYVPLSSAERFQFILARAFIIRPRILLIDEVFDHMGSDKAREIIAEFTNPKNPWSMIVATRQEWIANQMNKTTGLNPVKMDLIKMGSTSR